MKWNDLRGKKIKWKHTICCCCCFTVYEIELLLLYISFAWFCSVFPFSIFFYFLFCFHSLPSVNVSLLHRNRDSVFFWLLWLFISCFFLLLFSSSFSYVLLLFFLSFFTFSLWNMGWVLIFDFLRWFDNHQTKMNGFSYWLKNIWLLCKIIAIDCCCCWFLRPFFMFFLVGLNLVVLEKLFNRCRIVVVGVPPLSIGLDVIVTVTTASL